MCMRATSPRLCPMLTEVLGVLTPAHHAPGEREHLRPVSRGALAHEMQPPPPTRPSPTRWFGTSLTLFYFVASIVVVSLFSSSYFCTCCGPSSSAVSLLGGREAFTQLCGLNCAMCPAGMSQDTSGPALQVKETTISSIATPLTRKSPNQSASRSGTRRCWTRHSQSGSFTTTRYLAAHASAGSSPL